MTNIKSWMDINPLGATVDISRQATVLFKMAKFVKQRVKMHTYSSCFFTKYTSKLNQCVISPKRVCLSFYRASHVAPLSSDSVSPHHDVMEEPLPNTGNIRRGRSVHRRARGQRRSRDSRSEDDDNTQSRANSLHSGNAQSRSGRAAHGGCRSRFFNAILCVSMVNAPHKSLKVFVQDVITGLLEGYSRKENNRGRKSSSLGNLPQRLTERHFLYEADDHPDCVVCSDRNRPKGRRQTIYRCRQCGVGLCAVPCNERYHITKLYKKCHLDE